MGGKTTNCLQSYPGRNAVHCHTQDRLKPFVRAVICSDYTSERLFSKASKALQLMTLGTCHLLCCNFAPAVQTYLDHAEVLRI